MVVFSRSTRRYGKMACASLLIVMLITNLIPSTSWYPRSAMPEPRGLADMLDEEELAEATMQGHQLTGGGASDIHRRDDGRVVLKKKGPRLVKSQDSPCGVTLDPTELNIWHPQNPEHRSRKLHLTEGLYVSYSPERTFPLPLHGAEFDQHSELFIFFGGPKGKYQSASAMFQMDDLERRQVNGSVILDFEGTEARDGVYAVGFNTAWLAASLTTPMFGCHALTVFVSNDEGEQYRRTAKFAVVARMAKVGC